MSWFGFRWPVQLRFGSPQPDAGSVPVTIQTIPSGFAQAINNVASILSPLLPAQNPMVGAFVRDSQVPPTPLTELDVRYMAANIPDSRIGVLAIGRSPIGWRRPIHNPITLSATPGGPETETPDTGATKWP